MIRSFILLLLVYTLCFTVTKTFSQEADKERKERFQAISIQIEEKELAEPFKGITTDGNIQKDLFGIRSTDVSTEPVRNAATSFLQSLNQDQKKRTKFLVGDNEWRKWMNQDFYVRQGDWHNQIIRHSSSSSAYSCCDKNP